MRSPGWAGTTSSEREADVLRYQVAEIEAAHLVDPEEETALRLEDDRLADAGAYREAAHAAVELVDPGTNEGGVLDRLGRAAGELAGREAFDPYRERLAAAAIELSDVARSLRDELEGWEDDPRRLGTCRSGGGCWRSCGESTARTWRP